MHMAICDKKNAGRQFQRLKVVSKPTHSTPIYNGIITAANMEVAQDRENTTKLTGSDQHGYKLLGDLLRAFTTRQAGVVRIPKPFSTCIQQILQGSQGIRPGKQGTNFG